jgi:putative ABC transport system permease protein
METLLQDFRFALRTLARQRGFTAIAVVCLALGIGVNTVIFSVLNAMLLRPFPYRDPGQLVFVSESPSRDARAFGAFSYPNYLDYAARQRSFSSFGVYGNTQFAVEGADGPEQLGGAVVTASLFPTLGVAPILGRHFTAEEAREGGAPVVMLGYTMWEQRFNKAADIVGRSISVNGAPATVVGVMPPDFRYPGRAELWRPITASATEGRGGHWLSGVARLKDGVTVAQARADLDAVARQLAAEYPSENANWHAVVTSLRDREVGDVKPVLLLMQGAVLFVLLIAAANVANLLLARASSRQREIAIRTTLGAGRMRIVRQLLTESVLLALAGGALGVLFAGWGIDLVLALIPDVMPFWMRFTLDGQVLAFAAAVSLLTGFVFGAAPALQASRPDLTESLKDGTRGSGASRQGKRLRSGLVVAEVALSLVLLVGASLMMKSFLALQDVDPGFDVESTLTMRVAMPGAAYDSLAARQQVLDQIVERAGAMRGVRSAALVTISPLSSSQSITGFFVDREPLTPGGAHSAEIRGVSASYFETMRIALLRGRTFDQREMDDSAFVVVVNQALADTYFKGENPIGRRLRWGVQEEDPLLEIVGVVQDTRASELGTPPRPQMYVPFPVDGGWRSMSLLVAATGRPAELVPALRRMVREVAPDAPLFQVGTIREAFDRSVWQQRLYGALFTSFALIALLLAAAGVYSVIAYSVSQRTHEIGVRMALGAQRRDVFGLVVRGGVGLAGLGVAIGLAGAFAVSGVLRTQLYGVSATDPLVYVLVPLTLLLVAALASWLPARRAAALDPSTALRND